MASFVMVLGLFEGMFSPMHLLILGGIALLVFGHRLPTVARGMGRSIVEFKKGLKGMEDDVVDDGDAGRSRRDDRSGRQVDDGRAGYEQRLPRDDRGGAASNVRVTRDEPAGGADPYRDQAR